VTTAQTRSAPLLLVLTHAAVVPAQVLARALELATGVGPDGTRSLIALLNRHDVPLAILEPLCASHRFLRPAGPSVAPAIVTAALYPTAAAAYLNRPEHSVARLAKIVAQDARPTMCSSLLSRRDANPDAVTAVMGWVLAQPDFILESLALLTTALKNPGLPAATRAAAVAHYVAAASTLTAEQCAEEMDELHEALGKRLRPDLANALAHTSAVAELSVFVAVAVAVTDPAAADAMAAAMAGVCPTGATQPVLAALLRASETINRSATPPARAALARWWAGLRLPPPASDDNAHWLASAVAETVARLGAQTIMDLCWLDASRQMGPASSRKVELTSALWDAFATDDASWAAYLAIAPGFAGTVGELVAAVAAVVARPVSTVAAC